MLQTNLLQQQIVMNYLMGEILSVPHNTIKNSGMIRDLPNKEH